jgi:hypothetical protein
LDDTVNWIHLAEDKVQWHVLVKTVRYRWVPKKSGKFFFHFNVYFSEEWPCSLAAVIFTLA